MLNVMYLYISMYKIIMANWESFSCAILLIGGGSNKSQTKGGGSKHLFVCLNVLLIASLQTPSWLSQYCANCGSVDMFLVVSV